MEWKETDKLVLANMEEWQKKLKERIFDRETEHIPHAVAILAAVDFIVDRVKQSTVVTPSHIMTILENKFQELENNLANYKKSGVN